MNRPITKKLCTAVSLWTNERCKAKAVLPNTVKKGTREFLDDRFCQMHQPGIESKKKCICPHCTYHRSREPRPIDKKQILDEIELTNIGENKFGKKKKNTKYKGK